MSKTMWRRIVVPALTLCCGLAAFGQDITAEPGTAAPAIVFSKPDRIRYDSHSLIIDGKPIFIYSGAFHYFRCPRELWKDRLQKLKDAGLNCVETYLAWDVHEPTEPAGPDDFSKLQHMNDISDFIQTAQDLGLYVIIRPGPYICAEWDRGGLPGWLLKHKPANTPLGHFLRANDPEMLAWDRHWITAAAKAVKPHLVTNLPAGTPGVILWQLENEYEYFKLPGDVKADVLRTLGHAAIDNGIDVPLFTCFSKDKAFRADPFLRTHIFDTTNSYPGFNMNSLINGIAKTAAYQPEKFRAMSELQGGWFAQVGGKLSDQQGHNAAQINQLTLVAIEQGVTSMNYYMFYGGSNFGYGAARDLIQSYDYNAPLREPGGIADRYLAVKAIASMLKEHGEQLTRAEPVPLNILDNAHKDVDVALRRGEDGSQFYFIRTPQQKEPRKGSLTVQPQEGSAGKITINYDLPAFGAKVLYLAPGNNDPAKGEWLPKPEAVPARPESVPASIPITGIVSRVDAPAQWTDLAAGKMLIDANIDDQRYATYRITFELSDADLKEPLALRVRSEGGSDALMASVNGKEVRVGHRNAPANTLPLAGLVHPGSNTADILFENHGAKNFGVGIEDEQGISDISIVPAIAQQQIVTDWRMQIVNGGNADNRPEVAENFDDHDWKPVSVAGEANLTGTATAVFRGTLTATRQQIAAGLPITFGSIDDRGTVYVNGQKIGTADDWARPWTFDVAPKLHEGKNSIAVVVVNRSGGGGLYNGCYLNPVGKPVTHIQVTGETEGMLHHWETASTADGWQSAEGKPAPSKLLSWYRMQFEMPAPPKDAWVPWKLHLEADANAFVYFNGHMLGRYWAVGPQRDYWLPDCWLHQGDGQPNIIALQGRPTTDGRVIKAAEVQPFKDYAEKR